MRDSNAKDQRPIKFRIYVDDIMYYERFCEYLSGFGCMFHQSNIMQNVMQYTGLKDKNGKEIYEGDIVEAFVVPKDPPNGGTDVIGSVYFSEFEYCIESTDNQWPCISWVCIEECKVIGNIYENPELLEEVT